MAKPAPAKKGLTQTVRDGPVGGIVTGVILFLIGLPLLVLPPVGLVAMAMGLYCIVVGVTVLRGTDRRVANVVANAAKHPEAAEQALQAGLVKFPENPAILLSLARAHAAQGRYDQAAAEYRRVLGVELTDATAQGELADALLHLG